MRLFTKYLPSKDWESIDPGFGSTQRNIFYFTLTTTWKPRKKKSDKIETRHYLGRKVSVMERHSLFNTPIMCRNSKKTENQASTRILPKKGKKRLKKKQG
jgi:CRISPR/Cas system-associated protein endoribonuclease Cas2